MIGQEQSYNTRSPVSTSASKLTSTVAAIGEIEFTGNVVPHSWYRCLKLPSGHNDLVAMIVLAEILYQYRPGVVRDEATGEPLHAFKRFQRDRFCAPINYFVEKFCLTPDQVRQALKRLEAAGLITREYRDITIAGKRVHGMTFVEPVVARIREITPNTRTDLPPMPGGVQRPRKAIPTEPAAQRPGKPAAAPERAAAEPTEMATAPGDAAPAQQAGAVSAPEGAVSLRGGAVSVPLYQDTSEILTPTTTSTVPSIADERSRSHQQNIQDAQGTQKAASVPASSTSEPSATTGEEADRQGTSRPTPRRAATAVNQPAGETRDTHPDTTRGAARRIPLAAPAAAALPAATPSNRPAAPAAAPVEPLTTAVASPAAPAALPAAPATPPIAAAEDPVLPPDHPESMPAAEPPPPTAPLRFDFHLVALDASQQAELRRRLARLPGPLAQAVLDEYNSAIGRKVQFRNKWGWLEYLIRAALHGGFIPTSDLAERRAAQAKRQAEPALSAAPPVVAASSPCRRPSAVWQAQRAELERLFTPAEAGINLSPLRAVEDGQALWLEAPNPFVADWVKDHLPQIEQALQPHTALPIRVCIN